MKNQHFDLGAETVAFVRSRLMEVVGENPENLLLLIYPKIQMTRSRKFSILLQA